MILRNGHQLPSSQKLRISNVITTADLKQYVDARKFIKYPWGTYDLHYYRGLCGYVKDETIPGRVTVFLSGKMISTGAKTVETSILQLENTLELLVKNEFVKRIKLKPKIQNIVATVNFGAGVDLNAMARHLPGVTFVPEQFPGAIVRSSSNQVYLVFSSGKIVIVGSTSEEQLAEAFQRIKVITSGFFLAI